MRALVLLGFLALAGCASESGGTVVASLDAPRTIELLPTPEDLPAGFHVGHTQSQRGTYPHVQDGDSRVLERSNATEHQRLAVVALRFASAERAHEMFIDFTRPPSGETTLAPIELGDEALFDHTLHEHDARGGASSTVIVRAGEYLLTASHHSQGAPPVVDAREIARAMLAKL